MQLEFFGAAGEVTGSCHIVRVAGRQLLLDCGMIQGDRDAPARNRLPFPFDPTAIDAVILSHAHIDHCGRLPLLVKRGYRGPIYTNKACADLLPILLRDSANLALRDAERAARHQDRDDERVSPLYSLEDVEDTLRLLVPLAYDTKRELLPGVAVRVRDAGHILGSSSVELWASEDGEQRKLVFSGDLGQYDTPILQDPFAFESADLVLMESTYGNRRHRGREDTERELGGILAQPLAIDRHEWPWSSLRSTPMSGRGPPGPVQSAHPPWFCT
jgi:metallo-beta-lactamase family protein